MLTELAPLFVGDFAHYRDVLVWRDDPRPSMAVRDLQTQDGFDQVLQAYGVDYPGGDRRALASEWSKLYFIRLLPPVIAAAVLLNRRLDVAVDQLELVLGERAEPLAFKLADAGAVLAPVPGDPFAMLAPLLDAHLEPLIAAWAQQTKLAPRVFWSNAGNYFEWLVQALAGRCTAEQLAPVQAILHARERLDGRPNPLYLPMRYVDVGAKKPWRQRRVCCVRYLLPAMALCSNCPLCKRAPDGGALVAD